jgi:hypothetical protein
VTLVPKHRFTRIVALLWLFSCLALLLLTLLRHDLHANERSGMVMMVPVYFLCFPSGHIALIAITKLKLALYLSAGFSPSILSEAAFLWTFTVMLGYLQWFVLLPWLTRKCGQLSGALFGPRRAPPFD